jgi:hypothetical protein
VSNIPLGRLMHQVGCEYARAFQKNLATTGHLFENRYHATLVDTDAYFLEAIRYVHQNPIRAGMVTTVGQYRWSSHAAYVGVGEPWVTTDMALDLLSAQRNRAVALYRAFVNELPRPEVVAELSRLERDPPKQNTSALTQPRETRAGPSVSAVALDELMNTACRHFGVSLAELRSPARLSRLVSARAWVAQEAMRSGCATLADVARALGRDESTLRHLLKRGQR